MVKWTAGLHKLLNITKIIQNGEWWISYGTHWECRIETEYKKTQCDRILSKAWPWSIGNPESAKERSIPTYSQGIITLAPVIMASGLPWRQVITTRNKLSTELNPNGTKYTCFASQELRILVAFTLCRSGLIPINGPLTRYVKLRVVHAPGMPGTFSPPPTSKETAS